jgi:hypothetical protein
MDVKLIYNIIIYKICMQFLGISDPNSYLKSPIPPSQNRTYFVPYEKKREIRIKCVTIDLKNIFFNLWRYIIYE